MSMVIRKYDDWLKLSSEEQDRIHYGQWNTYERDGYGIALMASGRLALSSEWKVLESSVGTYHGGAYVLHMTVSDEDHARCPAPMAQRFEGFHVIWMKMSGRHFDPSTHPLLGIWKRSVPGKEAIFEITVRDGAIAVSGKTLPGAIPLLIDQLETLERSVCFVAVDRGAPSRTGKFTLEHHPERGCTVRVESNHREDWTRLRINPGNQD